ncbi:MAG: hypothetical protein E7182_00455 [Erysipelotrichaceae bacterium]|nr:hypothetical protein [Erysipelotrichaceae bacterium]
MKMKKTLLLAIPTAALSFGALAAALSGHDNALTTLAADYTRDERSLSISEGAVSTTFTVDNNDLDMRGWLLCLYSSKPSFDSVSRKLDGSSDLHPYSQDACAHYFFAAETKKTGAMDITWAANSADQKQAWSAEESAGEAGKTLADYLDDQDWYMVIGPRHYNEDWSGSDIGAGKDQYWENCDYYLGRKSSLLGLNPSGDIHIDLTQSSTWQNDNAKFALYFWKDGSTENAFSDFASAVPGDDGIYLVSYELDFTPTHMKAVRYRPGATVPSWDEGDKWNESGNVSFYATGVLGVTDETTWSGALATLDGLENPVTLDHYKRNGSGHSEHYALNVALAKDAEFKVSFNGESYNAFTTHGLLSETFVLKEGKIHVNAAGTYSLFFDTDETSHSLYITSQAIIEADGWATEFLANDCTKTMENWDDFEYDYTYELSDEAKAILLAIPHEADPTKNLGNAISSAIQRYDFVITLYGTEDYEDFIGRVDEYKLTAKTSVLSSWSNGNNAKVIVVVTLGAIAAATIVGVFLLSKKRKHEAN